VTGSLTLEFNSVNLSDWLTASILPWRAAALEKDLQWKAEVPDNLPTVDIDQRRMAQVLGNLFSNAVKYTTEGGSIAVSAGSDVSEVWFQISDTGQGVDPLEHDRVFEPFYRSQKTRRFPQGLGLGLTIARDIVEAHEGRLELTSEPGIGSQFTVYLPLNTQNS
jgi:signal transduction histidine kinase